MKTRTGTPHKAKRRPSIIKIRTTHDIAERFARQSMRDGRSMSKQGERLVMQYITASQ